MPIIGIIAEYNPFHQGHLYHLRTIQKELSPQGIICVLGGNFLQRGEPALVNKWARCAMALQQGIDLVFELPVLYATRSAYWFARGGIETLTSTGITTHLAFGVETKQNILLKKAAAYLASEPKAYQQKLQNLLKQGLSYPQARTQALPPEFLPILQSPNNILGLTYLQIIQELDLNLIPFILKRKGSDYLNKDFNKLYPSASAIRHHLISPPLNFIEKLQTLKNSLPSETITILAQEFSQGRAPIYFKQLNTQLMTLLRRSTPEKLKQIIEITEGLENRIYRLAHQTTDIQEFLKKLKTKRFTYTRLQRFLIHLLLDYTKEAELCLEKGPPYLRLLGFTDRGQKLLRQIKLKGTLPIISRGAQIDHHLKKHPEIFPFWEKDVLATNLYTLLYPNPMTRTANLDYQLPPVNV